MKTSTFLLLATAITLALSGCVVNNNDCDDGYCADISFDWEFELYDYDITSSCQLADISKVYITIYWDNVIEHEEVLPCSDGGAIIFDFYYPDTYYLVLEGVDPYGDVINMFEDYIDLDYKGINDFGYLTLDYLD